jgi:hypothetical protein
MSSAPEKAIKAERTAFRVTPAVKRFSQMESFDRMLR